MSKLNKNWPVLKTYDSDHLSRIALPLGGVGTGQISLGGTGNLHDWELMNRPAKGHTPYNNFILFAKAAGGESVTRALMGPVDLSTYEGFSGCIDPNHGLPRFRDCSFSTAYPLAQVCLADPDVPVDVRLEAFNPMVPADADASGIPAAILRYVLTNKTGKSVKASVCGTLENPVGADSDRRGSAERTPVIKFVQGEGVRGLVFDAKDDDPYSERHGTILLSTNAAHGVTYRTGWPGGGWAGHKLNFWDDFSSDGRLTNHRGADRDPIGSLAVEVTLPARATRAITFFITWRFPNRYTWSPKYRSDQASARVRHKADCIGNYYCTQYKSSLDAAEQVAAQLPQLEAATIKFVRAFCAASLPVAVREAALFNLAHLRSETCFRTPDGHFFGFEGCHDEVGCCLGSCTHVWNYEQAVAFLYGDFARSMREIEFKHATDKRGAMNFRVYLPLSRAHEMGKVAADGQLGCIIKMYRDWQLCGDDTFLKELWPKIRKAVEFCWIEGGWDGDCDGVMEGCQHNTMDVEYFGPNPQMQIWYLGALRAAEEMSAYLGEIAFTKKCRELFEAGRDWTDENLFNGEYYEHEIRMPKKIDDLPPVFALGIHKKGGRVGDYQLGKGCLVDQLVGQFLAHVAGLGYLTSKTNVRKTLKSIVKYNHRDSMRGHFNNMRTYALGDEAALLMASYPGERPKYPFPYFTEVMTGFEYTAAIGMLYERQMKAGLQCIKDIRNRYDGKKRSPFNEAECGNHYARAMASWGAILALTGFQYSAVEKTMQLAARNGTFFWSNGNAWGTCAIQDKRVTLTTLFGRLKLKTFTLKGKGTAVLPRQLTLKADEKKSFTVK